MLPAIPILRQHLIPLLLVFAVAAIAFSNSMTNSFHFDDEHSIVENPHIRRLENIPTFFLDSSLFSRNTGSEMYRPLVLVSYALNYRVGGYDTTGYHLVNLAIHIGCAWVLYLLLWQMGVGKSPSLIAALAFVCHPLATESVNYISSRSESLAAFFFLASLFAFVRKEEGYPLFSYCCYGAGLLAKSTMLGLPLVLLAYDRIWRRSAQFRRIHRLIPFLLIALGYLVVVQSILREAVLDDPIRSMGIQIATQLKATVYYAKLLAFPTAQTVEHQFFEAGWSSAAVVWSALALLSLAMVAGAHVKAQFAPVFFWAVWLAVVALPTFLVPLNVLVNERRIYLILAGLIGLVTWLLSRLDRVPSAQRMAGVAVVLFLVLTVQRNRVWASGETLWTDAQMKAPLMTRPLLALGRLHRANADRRQAEEAIQRALALAPESSVAWGKLGNLQMDSKQTADAEMSFRKALELQPANLEALVNLATLLSGQGRSPEALRLFQKALPRSRNREEVFNNMGTALLRMNRFEEAEISFRRALEVDDSAAMVHFNLGGALEGQHRYEEAKAAYERAIDLDPSYPKPYYNLGLLAEASGRFERALASYRLFLGLWTGNGAVAERVKERISQLERGSK